MGSAEATGILARVAAITGGADLGESYAGPFSDTHPLAETTGQPRRHMPTLAEALSDGAPNGMEEPSPFDEDQKQVVNKVVRHHFAAKRIPVYKPAKASVESSPFHLALKAATKRVSIARKVRKLTAKKSVVMPHVHAVLASKAHTPFTVFSNKLATKKAAKTTLPRKPISTKALLKQLQS